MQESSTHKSTKPNYDCICSEGPVSKGGRGRGVLFSAFHWSLVTISEYKDASYRTLFNLEKFHFESLTL